MYYITIGVPMPDNMIKIQVIGLDKVMAKLNRFPREIARYLGQAGEEAAKRVILKTRGLQLYPPATAANRPPTPYYIRGRGTQYKSKNTGTSERYGTQFYVKTEKYVTEIGNRSSYAVYVGGEKQPEHMAGKGWRKLLEVAQEKMSQITKVYQAWIDKLIHDLRL